MRLVEGIHQTSVLTAHSGLSLLETAVKMFSRWAQENFFKYMIADFDFDRMIECGIEPVDQKRTIPNPCYKEFTHQIKKAWEKEVRLEARIFQQMEGKTTISINALEQVILKTAELIEKINEHNQQIEALLSKRKNQPSRTCIAEMLLQLRYSKLMQESKKLKNAIIMLSYRAESVLYNILPELYKSTQKEGRIILKEIFTSDAIW